MTPTNKQAAIFGIGAILIFIGCFARPFGIPDPWNAVLMVAGGVLYLLVFWMQKRAKFERERTGKTLPMAPLNVRKRRFWMISASVTAGSIGVLPLLPYTVDNFQPWIYYWVIPAQILVLALFLSFLWKKLVSMPSKAKPN